MSLVEYTRQDGNFSYTVGDMRHRVVPVTNTVQDVVLNAKETTSYFGYAAIGIATVVSGSTGFPWTGVGRTTRIANTILSNDLGATYVLQDLGSDKFNLKQPIILILTQAADDEYIISFPEAQLSRSGETAIEAINWLKCSMVELYELFKKDNQLGPFPQQQLRILEKYIGEKPHRAR